MHIFHKWAKWVTIETQRFGARYPWTAPGKYASIGTVETQRRVCEICGEVQFKTVESSI
jgi:ribosomal protein L37AE/L43A